MAEGKRETGENPVRSRHCIRGARRQRSHWQQSREGGAGVQQVMEDAGLESPFREGVLEQTADFIREKLQLQ